MITSPSTSSLCYSPTPLLCPVLSFPPPPPPPLLTPPLPPSHTPSCTPPFIPFCKDKKVQKFLYYNGGKYLKKCTFSTFTLRAKYKLLQHRVCEYNCLLVCIVILLQPDISMHILYTVLFTFPQVLTRRICLKIMSLFSHFFLSL